MGSDSAQTFDCSNPDCQKSFRRTLGRLTKSRSLYCCRSCAAIVNNSKFPKRHAFISHCGYCGKEFKGVHEYCSRRCKDLGQVVTKKQIIREIQSFYASNKRISYKQEFHHYKAAWSRFGTWNNAIKAAGFEPNPVRFAKKYIANDGHRCDSLAEKIIDDWLFARKIAHEVNVPYNYRRMTADFKVNGTLIEFFGLKGKLGSYDRLVKIKRGLWKTYNLKVIEVHPDHLFPENKLSQVLKSVS